MAWQSHPDIYGDPRYMHKKMIEVERFEKEMR
jgi:hypothetical protein